ncbi:MAG: CAAX prenyl protease-related protein [Spartobacteria bacterium]|nr:CAAX prenyl protease-related protein [Spartobacteria bacterium]
MMNDQNPNTVTVPRGESFEVPRNPELDPALWAHILPFVAWLVILGFADRVLPDHTTLPGWGYAFRTVVCAALFLYLRPWRWYARLRAKDVLPALLLGVAVFVIWVLPETPFVQQHAPGFHRIYARYAMFPPWKDYVAPVASPYNPLVCGWPLALVRLVGSAFVIAVIEEFFWRGFIYRWMIDPDFLRVGIDRFQPWIFLFACLLFGVEHTRWIAGLLAGAAYGGLIIVTGNIWSGVVAHVTTNLLLGIYVLVTGAYAFW